MVISRFCDSPTPAISPQAINSIQDKLERVESLSKIETLMVGDSEADVEAARRAGVDSAAVTWGFRSTKQLQATKPTHLIDRPVDILKILQ